MPQGLAYARQFGFEGLDLNIHQARQMAEAQSVSEVKALWDGIKMGGWSFPVAWSGPEEEYEDLNLPSWPIYV